MPTPVKIRLENVNKAFGPKKVLQGINLNVREGESLVVIGGSGSGKSVLIKTIIGLIMADSGSIQIDGEEVSKISGRKRAGVMEKMGVLFQGGALFDSLPVWQNIAFGALQLHRCPRRKARDLAMEKLTAVGLGKEVLELLPAELSGGMQKRVALARAIALNPQIIFFDEPTTGLDPIMADVINDLIIKCSRELGATTITITHDMHSVRKIANNVAMIYKGNILWQGSVETIDHSNNPYVDQFIHGKASGPITMEIQDH